MDAYDFNPDLQLEHADRSQVAQTVASPGWKIIEKIMRSEVSKFVVNFINAPEEDDHNVVAKHKLFKAAAQFHTGVVSRINFEVQQFVAHQGESGEPKDPTAGMMDLGEFARPDDEEFHLDSLS